MTIADLIKDIIDSGKERIKSPITGAFTLSFIIYNWRPISILVFAEMDINNKIGLIDEYYCKPMALIGPLIISLLYVVGLPFLMEKIERETSSVVKLRQEGKYALEEHNLQKYRNVLNEEKQNNDIRSGNQDKEQLLITISSLERQRDEMLANFKAFEENSIKSAESSLKELNEMSSILRETNAEKKSFERQLNSLIESASISKLRQRLTRHEQKQFVDVYDFYVFGKLKTISTDIEVAEKLSDLGIIALDKNQNYMRTKLGDLLYDYILRTGFSD